MPSDNTRPSPTIDGDGVAHLTNLQRLVQARWWVFAGMSLLYALAAAGLEIPLPWVPILAVISLACLFNGVIHRRYRAATRASAGELFRQLIFDMSSLSALIFFSGGATNPLVSLLLPPVAIAALTLPARYVSLIVMTAIAAYSALLLFYLPLPLTDPARATRLHLTGMWLTFAASSVMIAWFILRMTRRIRQRDAELAAAREQGLRDERVLAIGTLAAGAAHELGTPLGTMLLITGELAADPKLPPAALDDIQLLNQQIMACKDIITKLSRRAGAERLENTPRQPVDRWLAQLCAHWQALRPQTVIHIDQGPAGNTPDLLADPRLEQALLNLLNNAANASQAAATPLTIRVDWNDRELIIELIDQGPGFPPAVLEFAGKIRFPAHAHGQGIGLMLTHSAIEQLGGQLALGNQASGGAIARITLPRIEHA
jgi:two-component system sensor histidine kinase RegB